MMTLAESLLLESAAGFVMEDDEMGADAFCVQLAAADEIPPGGGMTRSDRQRCQ